MSREVPPAPYVTETKVGWYGSSSLIAVHSCCSPASSLGGMNSKEYERPPSRIREAMLRGLRGAVARSGVLRRDSGMPGV